MLVILLLTSRAPRMVRKSKLDSQDPGPVLWAPSHVPWTRAPWAPRALGPRTPGPWTPGLGSLAPEPQAEGPLRLPARKVPVHYLGPPLGREGSGVQAVPSNVL